ncbi:MAG: ATP-binding protein [Pseudomonadota bacterium]
MFNRTLRARLERRVSSRHGRIVVLTGARQTGKTTLVREAFPDIPYISVEDPALRPTYSRLSAAEWIERFPRAIIDEVQKAPSVIESIKAAHDAADHVRYLLLGSSQILLLSRVRETLAGRAAIEELWPLTLPEMATSSWEDPVCESRLIAWLRQGARTNKTLLGVPAADRGYARAVHWLEQYGRFGGMPVLCDPTLDDTERHDWLRDYQRTYLERDVADLAALRDLEPFVLAQKAIAARSGRTINWSDLARTAGIAPATARRFLRYLELSYQVLLLPPYFRNLEKRLAKMPKLHFLDPGVLRTVLGRRGEPSGEELESAIVAEIYKQVRCSTIRADFYCLRTYDGREVDLLVEIEGGFVAFEIKHASRVSIADARHLRGLADFLDRPLLGCVLLSLDPDARLLAEGIVATPAAWALGAAG